MMELQLDHLVINAKHVLGDYERQFSELGFIVTPPSKHSLGSVNQSIVFKDHYLELVGLGDGRRRDLLESHEGIDGLVFRMSDPEKLVTELERSSLSVQPLQNFSRPVLGGTGKAEFSVIRLVKGQFQEGRIYFCQHHTPQFIWRSDDMRHPNGVTGIKYLYIASHDPAETCLRYNRLGNLTGFGIKIESVSELCNRFGMDNFEVDRFVAITFHCSDINGIEQIVRKNVPLYRKSGNRLWLKAGRDIILEFEA
ncbi:VOC family protein [Oxalobacter aliiformigenes]|uniref:VOC family protein n=1 Tax=Oxalobacter aliiformigenes TaxID=2946593 RepID=UPI0022AED662|nr:VOC family protein [Oxalobacter aliiformigenes]MCZ4064397.1 VOC family protein [Oxalobacter aliiformigenes]WAV99747.1 VOC family protein [Oxalobacter aliiformigenes]